MRALKYLYMPPQQPNPTEKTRVGAVYSNGDSAEMDLNIPEVDFLVGFNRWKTGGRLVQDAFPTLSAEEREFLISGITPREWNQLFPPEDDDDDAEDTEIDDEMGAEILDDDLGSDN